MYFTSGSDRAFEQLMQTRPGADHFDSGEAGAPEDCGTCRFYRPHWKYQFCVYEECPYQPGKRTALDGAVKFQVKGVDDEMAVFRVEKNRGYTVMSNHHLRNKDLSLKAKGLLSQMLSLPEDWDFTLKGLSLINREQIDAIRAAVRELEQAGYIVRSRERDSQGRLRGADYIIYEQPQPVPDSPTLENPTLDMLQKGFDLILVSSIGEAKRRIFEDKEIELILCDLELLDGTAMELFHTLRRVAGMFQMKNPPVRLLPFFILTENNDLATEYEYRHEGVNDYITAPVNIPELIRRVLFFVE